MSEERTTHRPPGLIYRKVETEEDQRFIRVVERWDITAPGCPLVQSPFHGSSEPVQYVEKARFVMVGTPVEEFPELAAMQ